MGYEAHEMAKKLVELLNNEFGSENIDVEILQDEYRGPDDYRVCGSIEWGIFNFSIGLDGFSLSLSLSWTKNSEFAYAHWWIGPHTKRRKPSYRKISKFWNRLNN